MNTLDEELKKIRQRLTETELSYVEIARRAGVHWKTVSRIASGVEANPRIGTLSAISEAIEGNDRT